MRVGSYSCPRHSRPRPFVSNEVRVVVAATKFGLPWHLSVTLLSGEELKKSFMGRFGIQTGPMLATDDVVRLRVAASRWKLRSPWTRFLHNAKTYEQHR